MLRRGESSKRSRLPLQRPHDALTAQYANVNAMQFKRFFNSTFRYARLLCFTLPTTVDSVLLVVALLSAIVSGVPFPLVAILFGQLIDDFNTATCDVSSSSPASTASQQAEVNRSIRLIIYLAIAQFVAIYLYLVCWSLRGARLAQRLRENYLYSLLQKDVTFFDNVPSGEISTRLSSEIERIRSGISEKVGVCLASLSFFVTAYVVAFLKHAELAGMLCSLIPAYLAMSLIGSWLIEKYSTTSSDEVSAAGAVALEGLSNMALVHAYGLARRLRIPFSGHLKTARTEGVKKAMATGGQAGLLYFIAYAANALAFWQGSKIVARSLGQSPGDATVGSVFTVIFVLVDATLILSHVAPFLQYFGGASSAFSKLEKDMKASTLIDGTSLTAGMRVKHASGLVEFDNVSFEYAAKREQPILSQVSFTCLAGKMTAIVGPSGSGKSTLASLVNRLYDVIEGSIRLDGHDVRDVNVRDLRGHISVVQQDSLLLNRSILENIAQGLVNSPAHAHLQETLLGPCLGLLAKKLESGVDLDPLIPSLDEHLQEITKLVKDAARAADAACFVEAATGGYGTQVGMGGKMVSGGQRQRLALARAIVKNPEVLILDEATASLDSQSEQRILHAVADQKGDRTIIFIAHRLSTVKNADKIIFIKDGRVLEEGTHASLAAGDGPYAQMISLQSVASDSSDPSHSDTSTQQEEADITESKTSEVPAYQQFATEMDPKPTSETSMEGADDDEIDVVPVERGLITISKGMWPVMKPHLLYFLLAFLAAAVVGGAFLGEAVIFGHTVERLSPCESRESILSAGTFYGLLFFILAIIEFFANFISWSVFGAATERILYTVRMLTFQSLYEQELGWHQSDDRTAPKLVSIITNDGNLLGGLSGSVIGSIASIVVNLIAAITVTLIIAWKIAIVCIALVPVLLGVGVMRLRTLSSFDERHEAAYAEAVNIGVEAIDCIKVVSSFSLEDDILASYKRALAGPKKETLTLAFTANIWMALTYFAGNLAYALLFWWGSKQILAGTYTQTQFIIVVFSLLVSAQLWSDMFALAPELSSARSAAARLLAVMKAGSTYRYANGRHGRGFDADSHESVSNSYQEKDIEDMPHDQEKSVVGSQAPTSVQFRNVSFAYPSKTAGEAVSSVSFDVKPGQFCAIVGPSGAGKSTIMALVQRLYRPSEGSILIDGVDVTRRSSADFRADVALVPQDNPLFAGSIAYNVGLGARPGQEASRAEVEEACRLANIHSVVEALPEGYDTVCGANGGGLSGGQRQRLGIARALVRRPRLLLLDEPTSALDAASEAAVQQGLDSLRHSMTVVCIAHRLHTIKKADVILMCEGGRIVDKGTFAELLARSASFKDNVLHQQLQG